MSVILLSYKLNVPLETLPYSSCSGRMRYSGLQPSAEKKIKDISEVFLLYFSLGQNTVEQRPSNGAYWDQDFLF